MIDAETARNREQPSCEVAFAELVNFREGSFERFLKQIFGQGLVAEDLAAALQDWPAVVRSTI